MSSQSAAPGDVADFPLAHPAEARRFLSCSGFRGE
jgi:hypothetical protein